MTGNRRKSSCVAPKLAARVQILFDSVNTRHFVPINPDYRYWFDKGMDNLTAGRYRTAIEDFDQAIRLNPDLALAYMNRGVAKGRIGHNREAILDYSKAIELDSSDACAFRNRSAVSARMKRFDHALADLDTAINLRSRHDEAYTAGARFSFHLLADVVL